MTSGQTFLGICGGWLLIYFINQVKDWWEKRQEHRESQCLDEQDLLKTIDNMKEESNNLEKEAAETTRSIMRSSLIQMGCQSTDNEDGTMGVAYQGENFRIDFGGRFARIMDPAWAVVDSKAPDFQDIKDAVNWTNFDYGPRVVMTFPNPEGLVQFHSYDSLPLFPGNPENTIMIKSTLDTFFRVGDGVRFHLQQIQQKREEAKQNRRPVGFSTNQQENNE